ncbi:alpha/beta fold hydrolase [Phenylobacterium sp.]|uniref:alpha/beta fold hydrolase n=1 Tax=Phenylobacterium sp. TaxID=1871053 RepID=UPI002897CFD2|nr:alpha/beta fold hydrolase [Phenylobacterium sp.]
MHRSYDRGPALEAERFFELWDRLEDDLETRGEAALEAVRRIGEEPLACRPLAPSWGLASAVFLGERPIWSGPAWRDLFGEDAQNLPRAALRPPTSAIAYAALPDRRGQPVLTAFARAAAASAWPVAGTWRESAGPGQKGAVVAMAFAPTRLPGFADFATRAYGLSGAEHDLLEQLVASSDLEAAAARLGILEAAARKRVRSLLRRTGAPRRGALLARLTQLVADESVCDWAREVGVRRALGLPPAEMRLTHVLAQGRPLPEAAAELGLSIHTVRDQARALLARTGLTRMADLPRHLAEARALVAFAEADETGRSDREGLLGATRIFQAGNRQIAAADFGPPDGDPVLFVHGGLGSRRVAPRLREALQQRGLRPIGIDRPGFGLTDVAPDGKAQFDAAADDMARVLDQMGLERVRLLSRDGGAPAALAFAARHPDRTLSGLLISPRPPRAVPPGLKRIDGWVRMGTESPSAIVAVYSLLRRKAGVRLTETLVTRLFSRHPADAALIADPVWRHAAVAELLTCGARTAEGLNAEQTAYPLWTAPTLPGAAPWTVVCGALDPLWADAAGEDPWRDLPGLHHVRFETGGRFIQDTHADEIAALVELGIQ